MTIGQRVLQTSPKVIGLVFVGLSIIVALAAFQRPRLTSMLSFGDTITASFARDYRLREYTSEVKIVGIPVGTVTDVADTDGGSVLSLKLKPGTTDILRTAPTAAIRPSTLLGGKYYVELVPGGDPGNFSGNIPVERTRIAVEADAVLESLQPQARRGTQQFLNRTDEVLEQDGRPALQQLITDSPATLGPAGEALDAFTGEQPDDLRQTIVGLDNTARVLNEKDGQFSSILSSFNASAGALDRARVPLTDAIGQLPSTLRTTRAGMVSLRGSLDKLTDTAADLQPTADELTPFMDRLDPVVAEARPVVGNLRELLTDARPLVEQLVPTADQTTSVLDDLRGPVLNRVNGPILNALNTKWHGEGPYKGNASDYKLYQDIAYAFANANGATKYTDRNGATLDIEAGTGIDDVSDLKGLPNLETYVKSLAGPKEGPR